MHHRRARGSVLALAAGLVVPAAARAMEVDARSMTVLNARQEVVDGEAAHPNVVARQEEADACSLSSAILQGDPAHALGQ